MNYSTVDVKKKKFPLALIGEQVGTIEDDIFLRSLTTPPLTNHSRTPSGGTHNSHRNSLAHSLRTATYITPQQRKTEGERKKGRGWKEEQKTYHCFPCCCRCSPEPFGVSVVTPCMRGSPTKWSKRRLKHQDP